MKTTIDIADALLDAAKAAAARENRTLRDLVEQGLRTVLASKKSRAPSFKLRDGSFRGNGLQPGIDLGRWDQVRDLIHEGQGS